MGGMFGSEMAQNTKEWRRDFIANDYKSSNNRGLPLNVTQDLLVSIPERQNLFNPNAVNI